MKDFELDSRLARDCIVLGELDVSLLLLMNNRLVPWFLLVPKVAGVIELYELNSKTQYALLNEINVLSKCIKGHFNVDKLNVAAIGNIVNQLHVHVVARNESDYSWPDVVWGAKGKEQYSKDEVQNIVNILTEVLNGLFKEAKI